MSGSSDEFVARPVEGRTYSVDRPVRLGDVAPDGSLRLDAAARFLQDLAHDDGTDSELMGHGYWVLRRLSFTFDGAPRFRQTVQLTTWCGGTGARWAERRTDLDVDGRTRGRAVALWVYVDRDSGRPAPLPDGFLDLYGPAAAGRTVRSRLLHGAPPPDPEESSRSVWLPRAVDFDVLGHLNNAAYWVPVEEWLAEGGTRRPVARAELEIRGGIDPGEVIVVDAIDDGDRLSAWLRVGDDVRATAVVQIAAS